MEIASIGRSDLAGSRLVYGCMRLTGDGSSAAREQGKRAIHAAIDSGYTVFDHADIYGHGDCESLFGEMLRESPALRDALILQTKCGVRFAEDSLPKRYNVSGEFIQRSVEGSLKRLAAERLDLYLLHRPDYLMTVDEIARTFERLLAEGKVGHFGVSNFSPSQFELLQSALDRPLLVNQVEINLHNIDSLTDGTLDQCQRLGVTPQAWSPLAGYAVAAKVNRFSTEQSERVREEVESQAAAYGVEPWLISLAWLLRHPARITPIVGSTQPRRIEASVASLDIDYQRADWYRLLEARNGVAVP